LLFQRQSKSHHVIPFQPHLCGNSQEKVGLIELVVFRTSLGNGSFASIVREFYILFSLILMLVYNVTLLRSLLINLRNGQQDRYTTNENGITSVSSLRPTKE
jgi:hypothetical protein